MSTTQKPKALRLAEHLEKFRSSPDDIAAASELRYQHDLLIEFAYQLSGSKARIADLEAQLSAIGAGGVEPLRKQASTADVADERDAFEKWLRIKPCGAAHDFGWEAWKARAAMTSNKKGAKK